MKILFEYWYESTAITITEIPLKDRAMRGYCLTWTEPFNQDSTEYYSSLPVVMMRAAALMKCVEVEGMFKQGESGFNIMADNFFSKTVEGTACPTCHQKVKNGL